MLCTSKTGAECGRRFHTVSSDQTAFLRGSPQKEPENDSATGSSELL